MAVSRKRAKLQPELLSTHAAAPAGDLSSVMIRARSRAKATATPVVEIADRLASGDRGADNTADSDTHHSDGLLFRKGAATGSSFRPDYWTFDRPEPKPEAPSEPLLAKRGTAPTPHKPQPQARAKADLSPKQLQEQIAALQALITSGGPEEEAEPRISADGRQEPPPPASLLAAMQPNPETSAAPDASAAAEPKRSRITGAIEGPAEPLIPPPLFAETEALAAPAAEAAPSTSLIPPPLFADTDALEPVSKAPLDAPTAMPSVEIAADLAPPAEPPTPEPIAEAEAVETAPRPALETAEVAAVAEIATDLAPPVEPAPEPAAEVEMVPPSSLDTPAATPAVELVAAAEATPEPMPALSLDTPTAEPAIVAEAVPQPEPIADTLPATPEPPIDAPSAEIMVEAAVDVAPEPVVEALPVAPEPLVDAPSADLVAASADVAPATEAAPLTEGVPAVATPPHELPVETPAVETVAIVVQEPRPEAVAEMPAPAEPVIELPTDAAMPPEPAQPEAIAEVLPAAPEPMPVAAAAELPVQPAADVPAEPVPEPIAEAQPPRDLPMVKLPAAPAVDVKLPAAAKTRRASTRRVMPAPEPIVAPPSLDIAAARVQEPVPAEPPATEWTEGLAELKTLLTELRQRTQAPAPDSAIETLTPVPSPTFPGLAALPPEPFPELPAQLLATQDLPPELHNEFPAAPPMAVEPPVAEPPAAEPPAFDDHGQRIADEHPHETVVANSLGNLIEDVLSRKSFSIAAVAAQQPRYGASEPMVEVPPSELDALLASVRTPDPVVVESARGPDAAVPPRHWVRLVDRVLAVVTVLMMVAGTYFGFSLLRDSSSDVQLRAITLPPAAQRAGSPIWSGKPATKDAGHGNGTAAHRPGSTQTPAR